MAIHPAIVVLGTLCAVGAAWLTKDWQEPVGGRLRGDFRSRSLRPGAESPEPAGAPDAAGTPAPAPSGGAPKPDATKPVPAKPDTPPKPKMQILTIEGLALPATAAAQDFDPELFGKGYVDLRVPVNADGDPETIWQGTKPVSMTTFAELGRQVNAKATQPFVIAADAKAPWHWVRWILETCQENYAQNLFLGAALPAEPKGLRGVSVRMPNAKNAQMPAPTESFLVVLKPGASGGAATVTADGKPVADLAKDVAAAWAAWSAKRKDLSDTSTADKTRAVLECGKGSTLGDVVPVIAAMRAAGIRSERYSGNIPKRPR